MTVYPYTTNLRPDDTLDAFFGGRLPREEAEKRGILGWNGIDVHWKLRPTKEEIAELPELMKETWEGDFKNVPDRPFLMGASAAA